jgi:hypothetical protein
MPQFCGLGRDRVGRDRQSSIVVFTDANVRKNKRFSVRDGAKRDLR